MGYIKTTLGEISICSRQCPNGDGIYTLLYALYKYSTSITNQPTKEISSIRCGECLVANFFVGPHTPLFLGIRFGEYLVCQLFVGPHFPYFWGARLGEYLVCQLFVGPHIPLFLRCQVWKIPGLPTFRWTSFPLFLRCQVWGIPGLLTFRWPSYFPIKSHRGSLDICWMSSGLSYIYIPTSHI